jgi:hypothetical protein
MNARWQKAWHFLGLRAVWRHAPQLWLDFAAGEPSVDWIADALRQWHNQAEDPGDFGIVHHNLMQTFQRLHGSAAALMLVVWVDHVFIEGGPDRAKEWNWQRVMTYEDTTVLSKLDPVLTQKVLQLRAAYRADYNAFKSQLAGTEAEISEAELPILTSAFPALPEGGFPVSSVGNLNTTIALIGNLNRFVTLWDKIMGGLSREQLEALYQVAKTEITHLSGGGHPDRLGFPGAWPSLYFLNEKNEHTSQP